MDAGVVIVGLPNHCKESTHPLETRNCSYFFVMVFRIFLSEEENMWMVIFIEPANDVYIYIYIHRLQAL
uniref:Uncharacterized protein n=1 Tax=Rhizophora mucronata TaxID=61149 RepID=A0A2P2N7S9_RHIMU